MQNHQLELFQVNPTWFHMFNEMMRSETWAKMSLSAKSLYPCLKSFCNHRDGQSFPSVETLCKFSGLTTKSVIKALKELEVLGYVKCEKTKGKISRYRMQEIMQPTNHSGQPVGDPIRFDYVPALASEAMKQIKNYVEGGMKNSETFPLLNITINQFINNGGIQIINKIDVGSLIKGTIDRFEGRDTEAAQYAARIESGATE